MNLPPGITALPETAAPHVSYVVPADSRALQ